VSPGFRMTDLSIPIIMIGAGTGFAPFRAFCTERAFEKENGKTVAESLLFFGCRHPQVTFFLIITE
jgi:cytochrome P450 / NADPH-cytochrome P450 reductase